MKRLNKRKGQGIVEYALVVALLALVCVAALSGMGNIIGTSMLGGISGNLTNAQTTITGS